MAHLYLPTASDLAGLSWVHELCIAVRMAQCHLCSAKLHGTAADDAAETSSARQVSTATQTNATASPEAPSKLQQIFGAYTPVTKELWRKRLQKLGEDAPDKPLPAVQPKAPEVAAVTYPFTSDPEMLEMVRCLCVHMSQRCIESCKKRSS